MSEVIIRKANIDDLKIIQDLNNELFKLEKENFDPTLIEDWPLSKDGENYFEDLINNHFVYIALVDDNIAGYLAGSINEKGSYENVQYAEVNNMLIKEEYRGLRIGRKLMDAFKAFARENEIYDLKVVASFKNKNAIEFYRKNGFEDFNLTLTMKIDKYKM